MDSTEFYRQEEMKAHRKCDELSAENESLHQQLAGMTKERDEIAAQANMLYRMVDEMDDQLAAALAAGEVREKALQWYKPSLPVEHQAKINEILTLKPDSSALRQHDEALIEKIAKRMADSGIGGEYLAEVIGKVIRELKGTI